MSTLNLEQEFLKMLPPYDRLLARMARGMWALSIVMGLMIVIAAFAVGLWNSGQVAIYFSQSKEIREAAVAGSALLTQLATIQSVKAWLEPLKFAGIAFLLTGISLALATIRKILQFQARRVLELVPSR